MLCICSFSLHQLESISTHFHHPTNRAFSSFLWRLVTQHGLFTRHYPAPSCSHGHSNASQNILIDSLRMTFILFVFTCLFLLCQLFSAVFISKDSLICFILTVLLVSTVYTTYKPHYILIQAPFCLLVKIPIMPNNMIRCYLSSNMMRFLLLWQFYWKFHPLHLHYYLHLFRDSWNLVLAVIQPNQFQVFILHRSCFFYHNMYKSCQMKTSEFLL